MVIPHYDKLEQLDRLRQSSALTQEEFEREKAALLAGGNNHKSRNMAIGAALLLVIVAAALFGRSIIENEGQSPQQVVANISSPIANETELETNTVAPVPVPQEAATTREATLDWAFSDQIIGLNPSFVEGKLGPAKSKSATQWEFDVRGCAVSYAVKGSEIISATTFVKIGCLPKVNGRTITQQTTFAQLRGGNGTIRASCLYNCGNAYDPTIDLYQSGFHANNFIDAVYKSKFGDAQSNASDLWVKSIRISHGNGPEYYDGDNYEWFQCASNPPATVVRAIGPERVGYVTIGRDLDRDGSCQFPS